MWHKKNSVPGKWPNRFRDAWERLLQFNKQRDFAMYQDAVIIRSRPQHAIPETISACNRRIAACFGYW